MHDPIHAELMMNPPKHYSTGPKLSDRCVNCKMTRGEHQLKRKENCGEFDHTPNLQKLVSRISDLEAEHERPDGNAGNGR